MAGVARPLIRDISLPRMGEDKTPEWDGMPAPSPILTLSWEDVWDRARGKTQSDFQRDPTKEEVAAIFEKINHKGIDCESGTFWDTVDYHVNEFYSGISG